MKVNGKQLILDELFDLTLYRMLAKIAAPETKAVFDELIPIEERHLRFWADFFHERVTKLNFGRRVKLRIIGVACRIFGDYAMQLTLQAIEVYGIRKYLTIWDSYRNEPVGEAVKEVLEDELHHEDLIVSKLSARKINPERIRNIFLGLNDGLVEITGAVSGFFAAFHTPVAVIVAAFTVAIAGSFSMAAGAYAAVDSEDEIRLTQRRKAKFLETEETSDVHRESPLSSAIIVGVSYFVGAMVPVLPIIFGASSLIPTFIAAGALIVAISTVLAFLSGMETRKRILTNVIIVALAVIVTYSVGLLIKIY